MDNAFSNLIPQYRIGRDGFNWWIGQVEKTSRGDDEVKGVNRYKVRIVGEHLKDCEVVPADDLPWASVMMPVTVPFNVGNTTGAHSQLKEGSWVIGFYLDPEKQKPIIMGSIGMTPGATAVIEEYKPGKCNSFTTFIDPNLDVSKDGLPAPANTKKQSSSQTAEEAPKREPSKVEEAGIQTGKSLFDPNLAANVNFGQAAGLDLGLDYSGKVFGNGAGTFAAFNLSPEGEKSLQTMTELAWGCPQSHNPPIPAAQLAPLAKGGQPSEDWCQEKASKCGPEDLKTTSTRLIGEFLAEVQRNNGNIGTYLVGEASGGIYDAVYTARKYTNKFVKVVKYFVAKVKGYIIEKLQEGVDKLVKALLKSTKLGNSLTTTVEWFNKVLKDLGCQMADITDRLVQWITDLLMGLIEDAYQSVACLIDKIVEGLLSKLVSLMEEVIEAILGPLESILGAAASALNIVGGAIAKVLEFLGITCSGPEAKCGSDDTECTNGEQKGSEGDFLDDLLSQIDSLFPDTSADYNQYTCEEAYQGSSLQDTTVGFRGGVFDTNYGDTTPSGRTGPSNYRRVISYSIDDITVVEGSPATFTITRTGYTDSASSVSFRTIGGSTAEPDVDFSMVDDIVGFAPNETEKTISVRTINDGDDSERDEVFFVRIELNSPVPESGIRTTFERSAASCTITQRVRDDAERYDPYEEFNFPPERVADLISAEIDTVFGPDPAPGFDETPTAGGRAVPQYLVTANKTTAEAGEFIVYTITTRNVSNGTVLGYTLSQNFNTSDIVGGITSDTFVVNNRQARVTVGIEDNYESDIDKVLRFSINSTSAFADVLVVSNIALNDIDPGTGAPPIFTEPSVPTVNPINIITDDSGKIIEIPIDVPGGPYTEPPFVFIGGEGVGATAQALLDDRGFVSELRVLSGGFGYKKNLPSDSGKRCIIDTFTLLRPGAGYLSAPTIYIDDDPTIAEAIINDNGFVVGARVLNREVTFSKIPKVVIIGGGGYGAKLMPSLACLPESRLVELGATKIGTGRYVDCP